MRRLSWWFSGKESTCQCRRHRFDPWVEKIPWRKKWQPIPVFLPGKSHGQRSLMGCRPRGHKVGHDWATKPCKLLCERWWRVSFPVWGQNWTKKSLCESREKHVYNQHEKSLSGREFLLWAMFELSWVKVGALLERVFLSQLETSTVDLCENFCVFFHVLEILKS